MAGKTKRQVEAENKSIKGKRPPDNDELVKNMKKGGLTPDMAGLNIKPEEPPTTNQTELTEEEKAELEQEQEEQARLAREQIHEKAHVITIEEALETLGISGPPTLEQSFMAVMMAYNFSQGAARQIARHAAVTGDANIFSDPEKLLDVMNEFRGVGDPSSRKNILDYYIKFCNLKPTDGYTEKVGLLPGQAKQVEEKKKEADRIYFFDSVTGDTRPPRQGETGMTSDQAQSFKDLWDKKHPSGIPNTGNEPEFIPGPDNTMIPNPNKKYSLLEHQALDAINRPGEITQLIQSEELKRKAQDAGILPGGGHGSTDMNDKYLTMMQENFKLQIAQSNTVMADALKTMTVAIEKMGTKPPEDPVLALVRAQLDEQKKTNEAILLRLDAEKEERHKIELRHSAEELAKVKEQITILTNRPAAGEPTEMSVIKDTLTGVGSQVGEIGKTISGLANQFVSAKLGGGPRTSGQQKIIDTIKDGARSTIKSGGDDELKALGANIFEKR